MYYVLGISLFGFVLLYLFFVMFFMTWWHVYSIFCSIFFAIKITKIWSIIETTANKKKSQTSWKPPQPFWFLNYVSLCLLSHPCLLFFSPGPSFIRFCNATSTVTNWWVDIIFRYAHQITTIYVLERGYALASWYTWLSPDLQLNSTSIWNVSPFVTRRSPFPADM